MAEKVTEWTINRSLFEKVFGSQRTGDGPYTHVLEPGSAPWFSRVLEVAEETAAPEGSWWYISFADGTLPAGTQFLGACYLQACSLPDALTVSHRLGINPGGEAAIVGPIPDEVADFIPPRFAHVLLSREQIAECDAEIASRQGSSPGPHDPA